MIRRLTALFLVAVLGTTLSAPAAASASATRTPLDCATSLDCTAEDINLMTMADRLTFVRLMQSGPGARLGVTDRWRNIEGVITFFRDKGLGAPGSWVSYVDAGIVEGIERGLAIALGRSSDTFGNPGSGLWATYITGVAQGSFPSRAAHDRAWAVAEQASTEHGVALAESHGRHATAVEQRFYQFSETYRWALRNRPLALDLLAIYGWLIHPDLTRVRVPFYDWFTDVRESAPSYKGCEMAYGFAQLNPITGLLGAASLFLAYTTELFDEYQHHHPT